MAEVIHLSSPSLSETESRAVEVRRKVLQYVEHNELRITFTHFREMQNKLKVLYAL